MKKIAIVGGSHAGKTTLVSLFGTHGYTIIPEAAIQVVNFLNQLYGIEGQMNWRMENYAEFQIMIANKQIELESKLASSDGNTVFLDGGLHDCIAYCRAREVLAPKSIFDQAKSHKYDLVFVLETLSNFDERGHTGRMFDKEFSIRVCTELQNVYREYGHQVIFVNEMPVFDRFQLVRGHIE